MSEEELRKYYQVYTDSWKFFRKYAELLAKVSRNGCVSTDQIDGDSYWDALVNESAEIYKKHGNTVFAKNVLVATTKEIERIYKEKEQ